MSIGRKILAEIKTYISEARKQYPEITDDILCDDGSIYYMNGNDGTDFDWFCNNRCCEFYLFYKETEYGFIKVFVNANGTMNGYAYLDKGYGDAIELPEYYLGKEEALYLASLLKLEADDKGIWDSTIDKINFDREIDSDEYLKEEPEEEDEYEYDDEDDWY